ncbi:MAG TPA: hypothetical protein VE262_08225 [Blastocatellia bacterium]|nr:hypothetical protein [Blastocatellia bacterium]
MESKNPNQEEVRAALDEAFKQISDTSGGALDEFVKLQERRVERLRATEEYLKETLGEDHPEVLALGVASQEVEKLKDALKTRAGRSPSAS